LGSLWSREKGKGQDQRRQNKQLKEEEIAHLVFHDDVIGV